MRFLKILAILLLATSPAWASGQPMAPLTKGSAVELSATNLGTAATTILAADVYRGYLRIQNISGSNSMGCTIDGTTPVIGTHGFTIAAGNAVVFDVFVPVGALVCIGSASSTAYNVTYLRGF